MVILQAMTLLIENESRRNFSNKYYEVPLRKYSTSLKKLFKASYPYFIQNKSKSINIPINFIDCNRIFDKMKELKNLMLLEEETILDDAEFTLWLPHHQAIVNLEDMTAVI